MNVTLVISSLNAGGAERVITTLANAWVEQGDNVSLITFEYQGYRPFYAINPKIKLYNLDLLIRNIPNPIVKIFKALKRFWMLRQAFKKQQPHCIISFLDTVNITTIISAIGLNIPVIISERVDPHYHAIGSLKNFLRKITYPFARHIVVQTKQIQNYFPQKLHKRISIIPNPVLLPTTGLPLPAIDFERKKIIAIGRLEIQKGFDLLLQAFKVIHDKYPEWELIIWGEGSQRPVLEALRNQLNLRSRVHLPGLTKNVYQALSEGSIFVLSSRFEGFPNSLCEAMAIGLPVVAFDCGSGPIDIIRPEIDGLLVPAQQVESLANAILKLARNVKLREQYGNRAKEIVDRFSLAKILDKWNAIRQF